MARRSIKRSGQLASPPTTSTLENPSFIVMVGITATSPSSLTAARAAQVVATTRMTTAMPELLRKAWEYGLGLPAEKTSWVEMLRYGILVVPMQ